MADTLRRMAEPHPLPHANEADLLAVLRVLGRLDGLLVAWLAVDHSGQSESDEIRALRRTREQ